MSSDGHDPQSAHATEWRARGGPRSAELGDDDLLSRLSDTLRTQIAPAVGDEYARTQAYMASVILERLGRQAAMGDRHREAEAADLARLVTELAELLGDTAVSAPAAAPSGVLDGDADAGERSRAPSTPQAAPRDVRDALTRAQSGRTVASLEPLVSALYRWGPERPEADTALEAIRAVLRRDIDRRMEIAE